MTFDIVRARRETPGCERVLHFNNAGAALRLVLDAARDYLTLEAEIGGYEAAEREDAAIERFYGAAAELLGCDTDEIAFVENATRAWDMAFYASPFAAGDRILTARAEYASNVIAFSAGRGAHRGRREVIPSDETGQISVEALQGMIDDRVKLIAITHVPTNGGLVNPAAAVGKVARAAGITYLLDACQSVGQMPVDVGEIRLRPALRHRPQIPARAARHRISLCPSRARPAIAATVPRSARGAVGSDGPLRDSPDARRFENWETNYAGKVGLAVAIDYARDWGLAAIWDRVRTLASRLRAELGRFPV